MFKKWLPVYAFVIAALSPRSVGATPPTDYDCTRPLDCGGCTAHSDCGSEEYCYKYYVGWDGCAPHFRGFCGGECTACYSNNSNVCAIYGNPIDGDCSVCSSPGSPGDTCSGSGPIELSSSCSKYNCFDGAYIFGYDISCVSGVSEAQCATTCCSQTGCKGFDYSASDQGLGAGRCCTSYVSRVEGGGLTRIEGGTPTVSRSCEKNSVTCEATDVACAVEISFKAAKGEKCVVRECPPFHVEGSSPWCRGMYNRGGCGGQDTDCKPKKICCGDHCCKPNVGAIIGTVVGVVALALIVAWFCWRCGCYRRVWGGVVPGAIQAPPPTMQAPPPPTMQPVARSGPSVVQPAQAQTTYVYTYTVPPPRPAPPIAQHHAPPPRLSPAKYYPDV